MNRSAAVDDVFAAMQTSGPTAPGFSECPICLSPNPKITSRHAGRELRKCLQCGASFVFPQPSLGEMEAHFEGSAALSERELESKFERNRERVLSQVAKHIQRRKQGGKILDVGCATGFFLAQYFKKPEWQACGVEVSHQLAEKAAAHGITVHCGNIYEGKFATNSFDVVSVIDAFYYFTKPQSELVEFHRVLKPDGVLVLELPLAASRIWRTSTQLGRLLSGTKMPLLQSSDHLFYYTPTSIALLLKDCGFHVESILPLPGNEQAQLHRSLVYNVYNFLSFGLYFASVTKILLTPRFLVVATTNMSD